MQKEMKWLFLILFLMGCTVQMAWYGVEKSNDAQAKKRKRIYATLTNACWLVLLILGFILLH
jgi:hypothetical protein